MDTYTKGVLTVIAAALVVIAFNMSLRPEPAAAFSMGPTLGDWLEALQDDDQYTDPRDVVKRAPLVAACESLRCYGWGK